MTLCYDLQHGYYTGKPWLIIGEEDQPPLAAFATEGAARDYIAEEMGREYAFVTLDVTPPPSASTAPPSSPE